MQKNPKGVKISIDEESPHPVPPLPRAIPFITFDDKKGFILNKEAEELLRSQSEDRKVGIISIVGKYRTGKSFFTNRVLLNHSGKGGFNVGPTINPCTKGLWIWNQPLKSENAEYPNMDVFLIDTEGFGGTDENVNHDSRIFLFSLLLSSFFIYNSVGNIDENALNALSLVINLAKDIQLKTGKTTKDQDPAQFFPSFLWVVRDFTLKLVDLEGKPLGPKEYLEKALELQKGVSDAIESKNRIRKLLKHFFQDRDCVTFVRPLEDENQLQKLDETPSENLRPEFVDQMEKARKKIFTKIKPKALNGNVFNGNMLVELIMAYLNAINSGQVPNIEHAFQYMMKNESKKAFQDSLMKVEKELTEYLKSPVAQDEGKMRDIKKRLAEDALKNFKKKALGQEEDLQDYMNVLSQKVKENFKKVKEKNIENWNNAYQEFSAPYLEDIEQKLKNDGYSNYYEFQIEFNKFKEKFEKEAPNGPEKPNFLKIVSEKIYATAAESISKKTENVLGRETMRLKKKIEETEDDFESRKKNWERDREEMQRKLQDVERERAQSRVQHQSWREKYDYEKVEKEKSQKICEELNQKLKELEMNTKMNANENNFKLEKKLESIKAEHEKIISELERRNALLNQELSFAKKENESMAGKIKSVEKENHRLKDDLRNKGKAEDDSKRKIAEIELSKTQEIMKIQMEFERKLQESKKRRNSDDEDEDRPSKKKNFAPQYPNWLEEKIKLENEINFLKGKLEEGQKVQEAFKMAIERGVNFNDNDNIQTLNTCELVETNRNLSQSLENSEARLRAAEAKILKMKSFKKIIKNGSGVQCLHCAQIILIAVFPQHLIQCAKIDIDTAPLILNSGRNNFGKSQEYGAKSSQSPQLVIQGSYERAENIKRATNETQKIDENNLETINKEKITLDTNEELIISIAQTLIKETPDHKPYIEYLIYCKKQSQKWMVSRKYKNFCELHQILISTFPGYNFPSESRLLINSFNDFNSLQDLRKPKIIDERKMALEFYLKEISKSPEIRNASVFRMFIGVEGKNSRSLSNDFLEDNFPEDEKNMKYQIPQLEDNYRQSNFMPSFRIDKKMLPESPESFMRSWENNKSTINNSSRKLNITPTKLSNNYGNSYINNNYSGEKNEMKEIIKNMSSVDDDQKVQNTTFVYECGHSLTGQMVAGSPKIQKVKARCPGCSAKKGNQTLNSARKY